MKCPCGGSTIVKDGRLIEEGYWRRRRCDKCGVDSTTLEQVCETIKGTRLRQAVIAAPKPPAVKRPKNPHPVKRAVPVDDTPVIKARTRMEDARMQRELEEM